MMKTDLWVDLLAAARSRRAQKEIKAVTPSEDFWITPQHVVDGSESALWDATPLDKGCYLASSCTLCPLPEACSYPPRQPLDKIKRR